MARHKQHIFKQKNICIILGVFIAFPFVLNFFLQLNNPCFNTVGNSESWLNFWPTYLSSVASFIMAYIAFMSLRQVQSQIEDAKRKEKEHRRANLKIDMVKGDDYNYYIRFRNVGYEDAYNIVAKIDMEKELLEKIGLKGQEVLQSIQKSPFFIPAQESMLFYLGSVSSIDQEFEADNYTIKIKGQYNQRYCLKEIINIREFICKHYGAPRINFDTVFKFWFESHVVDGHITNDFKSLVSYIRTISEGFDKVTQSKDKTETPS